MPRLARSCLPLSLGLGVGVLPWHGAAQGGMPQMPGLRDWRKLMDMAQADCEAYAALKAKGVGETELEDAKQAARTSSTLLLMTNTQLFNTDAAFRESVMPQYKQAGASLERSSKFVQACFSTDHLELRTPWGYFMESMAMDAGCRLQDASEFEGRCFPSAISNAMDAFQWSGEPDEMQRLYERAKREKNSKGRPLLRWKDPLMHPMITIPGLRNKPVWKKEDDPSVAKIMDIMEKNVATFQKELGVLRAAGKFSAAYDHLIGAGSWTKVALFNDGAWDEALCQLAPESCKLLRGELPGESNGLPYIVNNHEEVAFFYAGPKSHVLAHSGQQNCRLNLHLGLEGFDDSELIVHTGLNKSKSLRWSAEEAFAFNDGWQHEVRCGDGHRYVLIVGVMHPDLDEAAYAGAYNSKTFATQFKPGQLSRFLEAAKKKKAAKDAAKKSKASDSGEL